LNQTLPLTAAMPNVVSDAPVLLERDCRQVADWENVATAGALYGPRLWGRAGTLIAVVAISVPA